MSNGDRPGPDPTTLTTQQLERQLLGLREIIETRLDASDRAIELLQAYPTALDKAIDGLGSLLGERFQRVEQAVELKVSGLQAQLDGGLKAQRDATALALEAVNKATQISQQTAERAMAKAEAAAEKVLLTNMIDALRDNFQGQIISTKEQLAAAMAAQEKAVQKAENATEKRFDSVNEFRQQLNDQALRFMPRTESDAYARSASEKIDLIQSRMDRLEGRTGGYASAGTIIAGAISVVTAIIASSIAILAFNN